MDYLDAKVIRARTGPSVAEDAVAQRIDQMYQTTPPAPPGTNRAGDSLKDSIQRYDA
jgi:hypothetical protein